MAYRYIKAAPAKKVFWREWLYFVPLFVFTIGLATLIYAGWPIIFYELVRAPMIKKRLVIKPYVGTGESSFLGLGIVGADEDRLVRVSNWLPSSWHGQTLEEVRYYSLSIPSLKINDAVVCVGCENLSENLVQYGGTAYPGNFGNAVIFGHSSLPQFFNPENYMTIFSYLPTLKEGEKIFVNFDGVRYAYQVEEMVEVGPDDLSILEQHYDDSYLTLVTCVPPGTSLRRLVVRARLIKK